MDPRYTLTPSIALDLMQSEAARALVEHTPLTPAAEAELRHRARTKAAHYSNFIEGNRLSLEEAKHVIAGDGWLEVTNQSRRARAYSLSAKYRQYVGSLSATPRERERDER